METNRAVLKHPLPLLLPIHTGAGFIALDDLPRDDLSFEVFGDWLGLLSRAFEDRSAVGWQTGGWNDDGRNTSMMLEVLWAKGEVMIAGRAGANPGPTRT